MQPRTIKTPPAAKRLIESLRDLGYECKTAIADLLDNSISAGATKIHVSIEGTDSDRPYIVISDNGEGMDRESLIEAMRFGAEQNYSDEDLGKFGLGLKTASLSQCRNLTVASKPKPTSGKKSRRNIMRWDLDHIYKKNDWDLQIIEDQNLTPEEIEIIDKHLPEKCGTVVIWQDMKEAHPGLYYKDENKKQKNLGQLLGDIEGHLAMVFHRFMQGSVSRRPKLTIYLQGNPLEPWDPFCISEDNTESIHPETGEINDSTGKGKITITPYILPKEKSFSSQEKWKKAAGPRGWNLQQGFYFYRNGRLLQAGGWSYMRKPDEHTKLLRIAIDFPANLDKAFQVNVTKMKSKIPDQIWNDLKDFTADWAQQARTVYGEKSNKSQKQAKEKFIPKPDQKMGPLTVSISNTGSSTIAASLSGKDVKIIVPFKHPIASVITQKSGRPNEQRNFLLALLSLLEAVYEGKLPPKKIPLESIKKQIMKLV
ncbi:ATP-binding protein [Bdellovibrio sp. HCB288]|uniref:ATP-binding protein n=1 Tax=Bdellovibrio sp. HCB288 TaxID=3394355 RepID=UPI0039B60426